MWAYFLGVINFLKFPDKQATVSFVVLPLYITAADIKSNHKYALEVQAFSFNSRNLAQTKLCKNYLHFYTQPLFSEAQNYSDN